MKRFVNLCMLVLMSIGTYAQIDTADRNWRIVLDEGFSRIGRQWNNFIDDSNTWRAFDGCYMPSGVTRGMNEHIVYQQGQCVFNYADSTLVINSLFTGDNTLVCGDYSIPPGIYSCDTTHKYLYYYSGIIQSIQKYKYGYFEVRCKLPVHKGAFPAFWMWGDGTQENRHYEEIDIFEYSWFLSDSKEDINNRVEPGSPRCFSSGIWYNPYSTAYIGDGMINKNHLYIIDSSKPALYDWHTFGCEWLPGSIKWYLDGNVVNEMNDTICGLPHDPMMVMVNYSIDNYALIDNDNYDSKPEWKGVDSLTIDYCRIYQLIGKCDHYDTIRSQHDLDCYDYGVKGSVTILPDSGAAITFGEHGMTIRAVESITIEGECDITASSTLITHPCIE